MSSVSENGGTRTKDIVLAVMMTILAIVVTLPATMMAAGLAYHSGGTVELAFPLAAVTFLNGYVLGYPAMVLLRRWHHRIRHGKSGYDWVWGHYWRLQFQMLYPFLLGGYLLTAIAIIQWSFSYLIESAQ